MVNTQYSLVFVFRLIDMIRVILVKAHTYSLRHLVTEASHNPTLIYVKLNHWVDTDTWYF